MPRPTRAAGSRCAPIFTAHAALPDGDPYVEVIGRPTGSTHRGYLVWKIREARKGDIPVGPSQRPPTRDPGTKRKVLPLRMAEPDVEVLDAVWKRLGFKSRMAFLRHAMASALHAGGDIDAAIALRG